MSESAIREPASPRRGLLDPLSSRSVWQWFGVLGPPAAWATHVVLGDLIFELGCAAGVRRPEILALPLRSWAIIQTAVLLSISVLAGVGAARTLRLLRGREDGTSLGRARALAATGIASAAIFGLLIAFGLAPELVFRSACRTSL